MDGDVTQKKTTDVPNRTVLFSCSRWLFEWDFQHGYYFFHLFGSHSRWVARARGPPTGYPQNVHVFRPFFRIEAYGFWGYPILINTRMGIYGHI